MGETPAGELGTPSTGPATVADSPPQPPPNRPAPNAGTAPPAGSDSGTGAVEDPPPISGAAGDGEPLDDARQPGVVVDSPAIAGLTAALRGVERQAEAFHTRAQNYEHIIRQMELRIEQLQGDQVQALLKPLIQRIAALHAQAVEASDQARERGEKAEKDFQFFAVAIEEALSLIDIESVAATPSIPFDPRRHHAVRVLITDDPALDGRVHRVLRQGFTYPGAARVFLPAQVSIYRFKVPPAAEAADLDHEHDSRSEPGEGASVG